MPTKKPRITVTVPQHVYDLISRFAELQGTSRSQVVSDLLEGVYAPLVRTVALIEAAKDAPAEVMHGLRGALEGIEKDILKAVGQVQTSFGDIERTFDGGTNPRISNTGVTSSESRIKPLSGPKKRGGHG